MKRGKKIVIHIIVIVVLLFASCYFGGFYFSQHACTVDYLKALDNEKEHPILNIQNGKKIYVLTGGQIENQYSVIYLKKVGFLYQREGEGDLWQVVDYRCYDANDQMIYQMTL